jgi:membrane associated rhomboid family serine protease
MRRRSRQIEDALSFGGRVPAATGFLMALTVLLSIASVLGAKFGAAFPSWLVLQPELVWSGQVWRLVSWIFVELQPINLIFAVMVLYWVGRDLTFAWGTRRFLLTYFGIAAGAALATCLLARVFPGFLAGAVWSGPWPIIDAMVVAWALLNPDRQIMLWFVLPVSGRGLLYLTIGGTLAFTIWVGLVALLPHLLAEALMLAYANEVFARRLLQRYRLWGFERRARTRRLKVVGRRDGGGPPTWLN